MRVRVTMASIIVMLLLLLLVRRSRGDPVNLVVNGDFEEVEAAALIPGAGAVAVAWPARRCMKE